MPRVKRFNEKEVLAKAMELFWKQGYAATSIQDLVAHLGINRASLYDTFGDKKELFQKAFELYRCSSIERLKLLFENEPNVKKGLSELFNNAIKEAVLDPDKKGCFAVNSTTELIPNDDFLVEVLTTNKRDFENLFYQYLKKGEQAGQLKAGQNLKALASYLYLMYNGLLVVSKIQPSKKTLAKSIEVALSMVE
jgi:TetR/AcrR family transcriptional repressor of nem operon